MRKKFIVEFQIFKILLLAYSICFWIYAIIDDFVFIEKYGSQVINNFLIIWFGYYMVYLVFMSLVFWLIVLLKFYIKKRVNNKQ